MEKLGVVQEKILTSLAGYVDTATGLAGRVYDLGFEEEPTRSQRVSIHRALRSLERKDFVRLSNQFRKRERCWELTGKLKPAPPEKKKPKLKTVPPSIPAK